jgi:outer membrane protein OmpU
MNTFKKIGLTALASSLVVTSAYAGEMSVSGSASMGVKNNSHTATGKSWTMGNQLTFSGGGELDNGLNVSLSFVLDQADDTAASTGPFDSHSITISSDSLGTLVFAGEGGSTASGGGAPLDLWDNGFSAGSPDRALPSNNMLKYTLPTIADGFGAVVSYTPKSGTKMTESDHAWNVSYTGIEGLSLSYGQGTDSGSGNASTDGQNGDQTKYSITYAYGPITAMYTNSDYDGDLLSEDEETTTYQLSYTVTENVSISYAQEEHDEKNNTTDEEFNQISASYTSGGMTVSLSQTTAENDGNSATVADKERWKLGASFAF